MDEIKFYKRALSDQEVYGLFAAPSIQQQIASSVACNTGSVTLDATAFCPEAVSYQWYYNGSMLGGQTSPTLSIPSLNASNTGNYVCAYSNFCSIIPTDTAMVQLLAASNVSISPDPAVTCSGVPITLTASSPAANSSFAWSNASGVVNTSSAITPTLSSSETLSLAVTSGTCSVQTVITVSVSTCTGVNEQQLSEGLSVYPNPVKDRVTIRVSNLDSGMTASIQAVDGRILRTIPLSENETQLTVSDLSDGIYFITVSLGNAKSTYKIIKQ